MSVSVYKTVVASFSVVFTPPCQQVAQFQRRGLITKISVTGIILVLVIVTKISLVGWPVIVAR